MSSRKLSRELSISRTSVQRVLRDDLGLQAYKMQVEPLLSEEKIFDIDGVYNSQNQRIWVVNRAEADARGCIRQRYKFSVKGYGFDSEFVSKKSHLWSFSEKGIVDHDRYISEVLPIALKYGNKVFGNDWTFQKDGASPHTPDKSQAWCAEHFPSFIAKDRWPPNSPDLNLLDYCVWDEFVQAINWGRVTSKATLILELKLSV